MPSLRSSATNSAVDLHATAECPAWTLEPAVYGWRGRFRAMANPCEVHLGHVSHGLAEAITDLVCQEAKRVERKFSRYLEGNIVDRINTAGGEGVMVDDETARLIDYAASLHALSEGRFDITSGIFRRAWTFNGSEAVPSPEDIDVLRAKVGWDKVSWLSPILQMPTGMEIDLGGIGKEYAVDRAADLVRPHTDRCMINFGGDLVALGQPQRDGNGIGPWTVGIESLSGDGAERRIALTAGALATSGDTRRYLVRDGRRYGHILDARTGWPVVDAPRSVTVLGSSCTQAGMLATLAMMMGADAENFLQSQDVTHWILR